MTVDACTAEVAEGQTLARDIEVMNSVEFAYRRVEFHTGRIFETKLYRVK